MSAVGVFQINTRRYGKTYNLAQLHGRVQVTSSARSSSPTSFLNMLQTEMAAIRNELRDNLARELYGSWADRWEYAVQRTLDVLT